MTPGSRIRLFSVSGHSGVLSTFIALVGLGGLPMSYGINDAVHSVLPSRDPSYGVSAKVPGGNSGIAKLGLGFHRSHPSLNGDA